MEYMRSQEEQERWDKAFNRVIIAKFIGYFFLILGLVAFIYYLVQLFELSKNIDKINSALESLYEFTLDTSELKIQLVISAFVYLAEGVSLCVVCNIVSRLVEHKYNMEIFVKKQEMVLKTLNDKVENIEHDNASKKPQTDDDVEQMK